MSTPGAEKSEIWQAASGRMAEASSALERFREPGGPNSRLAHWEPRENSLRWFKSYLLAVSMDAPSAELALLADLEFRSLGNPIEVTIRRPVDMGDVGNDDLEFLSVNLDYLYAAEEARFVLDSLGKREASPQTVVEVGAGFGRTAHMLLHELEDIDTYMVIDLPETLQLSRAYLTEVLPPRLASKCVFVTTDRAEEAIGSLTSPVDLAIQIDGLQEMRASTIDYYYSLVFNSAEHVFVSGPVGKFLPETAGLTSVDPEELRVVFSLGRSQTTIDPWDVSTLEPARVQCANAYCPAGHTVHALRNSRTRPHYLHAMYRRQEPH
jgi:putative sugar O-methyltransferase